MKVLDLFSGIGGFSIGLERTCGFETVAFCEADRFCQTVLKRHWPDVPCYPDIKALDGSAFSGIDVVTGGYPCQPFSTASHGKIVAEDLWPEMERIIRQAQPRYVLAENVSRKAQEKAEKRIGNLGYKTKLVRIAGADLGADHKRVRWWLFAYTNNEGELSSAIDAEMAELPKLCKGLWGRENYARAIRVPDGLPNRVDRLRALGNTVFPQIPEMFGEAILNVRHFQ